MTAIFGDIVAGELDPFIEAGYELAALNFLAGGVTRRILRHVRWTHPGKDLPTRLVVYTRVVGACRRPRC